MQALDVVDFPHLESTQIEKDEIHEQIVINQLANLVSAFMPFIKNGGLFFVSRRNYQFGEILRVEITLPYGGGVIKEKVKVVWHTPITAQGQRMPGIGVQFLDNGRLKHKIEELIVDVADVSVTHTL